jgi:hypothetical protein
MTTKTCYWTLRDERKDDQMGGTQTLTYEASAPGGILIRTVTRNRESLVESMMFVPMSTV